MRDVTVDVDITGTGTFVVGGVDISQHVQAVIIRIEPGQLTRVEFDVVGDVALDAKAADVTVSRNG